MRFVPLLLPLLTACTNIDPINEAWAGVWQVTHFEESPTLGDCETIQSAAAPEPFVSTALARGYEVAADVLSVYPCTTNVDCSGAPWVSSLLDELTETDASGSQGAFSYFSPGTALSTGSCSVQFQSVVASVDGDALRVEARATTAEGVEIESEQACSDLLSDLEEAGECDAIAILEATRLQ